MSLMPGMGEELRMTGASLARPRIDARARRVPTRSVRPPARDDGCRTIRARSSSSGAGAPDRPARLPRAVSRRPLTLAPTSGALPAAMSQQSQARALTGAPVAVGPGTAFIRQRQPRGPARHAPTDVMADPPHGRCQCRLDAAHPGGCHGPAAWVIGEPHDRHNVCSYCTGPDDMAAAVLLAGLDELDAYAA